MENLEVAAPEISPVKRKKGKGVLIAIIVVLVAALGVGAWFGYDWWSDSRTYDQAIALLAEKNYDEALKLFKELGDFEDSAQKAAELTKQQADYDAVRALLEQEKLGEAQEAIATLGDYRDCSQLRQYLEARLGVRGSKKADVYAAAAEKLEALGTVEDSKEIAARYYLKAAYLAVDDSLDPQPYLDKLTEEQRKEFEEHFHDEQVLEGWEEALEARYKMEFAEQTYTFDYTEKLELLEPLTEYECRDQKLEDLVQEYYEAVDGQRWNLYDGYVMNWLKQYELDLTRSEILTEMHEKYDFLKDNEELCHWYVGWDAYYEACVAIEGSLSKWSEDLEAVEYNGKTFLEYTKDVPYRFKLYLTIYYYDEDGELISTQESGPIPMIGTMAVMYPMNIPKGMSSWDVSYKFSGFEEPSNETAQ